MSKRDEFRSSNIGLLDARFIPDDLGRTPPPARMECRGQHNWRVIDVAGRLYEECIRCGELQRSEVALTDGEPEPVSLWQSIQLCLF